MMPTDPWSTARFNLKDAQSKRQARRYLVFGVFEIPSVNMVFGPPGDLKSMLMGDCGICISSGCDFLAPMAGTSATGLKVIPSPVIWLDFDNGKNRSHERFDAIASGHQSKRDDKFTYYVMPSPWLDMSKDEDVDKLIDRIKNKQAKVLFVDNFGLVRGNLDENAPEIAKCMCNFRRIAEQADCAVIIIHHQRKGNGTNGRAGDMLRGHTSIEAALDLALIIEREAGSDLLTIRSTKSRGATVQPFGARFTYTHKSGTDELETARFFGFTIQDLSSDTAVEKAIEDALKIKHPLSKGDLASAVKVTLSGVGINRIRSLIDFMANAGKLKTSAGSHGSKLYDL